MQTHHRLADLRLSVDSDLLIEIARSRLNVDIRELQRPRELDASVTGLSTVTRCSSASTGFRRDVTPLVSTPGGLRT